MPAERRVAACLLLLVTAVPLLLAQLPQHIEAVVIPMVVVLVGSILLLSPLPSWAIYGTWIGAIGSILAANAWSTPLLSWSALAIAPLGLAILAAPTWVITLGFVAGPLAAGLRIGWSELAAMPAFTWQNPADTVGWLGLLGWLGLDVAMLLRARWIRYEIDLQRETADALDEAMKRDRTWLEGVARTVADASLHGPIRGIGLGPEVLSMAARVDSHGTLLAWIEGEPLATLTVGWSLCAASRAGQRDPQALLRMVRTHFDEVLPPQQLRWVAIWDRRTQSLQTAGAPNPGRMGRLVLTPHGPASLGPKPPVDTERTLADLHDDVDLTPLVDLLPDQPYRFLAIVMATMSLMVASLVPIPGPGWFAIIAGLIAAHELLERDAARLRFSRHGVEGQLRERAEIHDDLRFRIAHLHGSLLAYRINVSDFQATAHRLQGEVLNGTFANMVVDAGGRGQIVAGEIAGRGIAARFLGLAAQITGRVLVERGSTSPADLPAAVAQHVRGFGRSLGFPTRLRLGVVTLRSDGYCEASGTLRRLVRVWAGPGSRPDGEEPVEITEHAWLNDETRVYLTPAPALPGPEDDAPALAPREATDRVVEALRSGQWHPVLGSLASLFSVVFDGVHAPPHGTLIELARRRPENEEEAHADAHVEAVEPSVASGP